MPGHFILVGMIIEGRLCIRSSSNLRMAITFSTLLNGKPATIVIVRFIEVSILGVLGIVIIYWWSICMLESFLEGSLSNMVILLVWRLGSLLHAILMIIFVPILIVMTIVEVRPIVKVFVRIVMLIITLARVLLLV